MFYFSSWLFYDIRDSVNLCQGLTRKNVTPCKIMGLVEDETHAIKYVWKLLQNVPPS